MIDIEKEMIELLKINVEYPNFAEKCSDFKGLWEGIADLVDIAIDNLQHFNSFKNIKTLIMERERASILLRSFSIVDRVDNILDIPKVEFDDNASDTPMYVPPNDTGMDVNLEEFEEAKKKGIFMGLSMEEDEKHLDIDDDEEEDKNEQAQQERDQADLLKKSKNVNLNKLIMKRMELLMKRARNRNPLSGMKHEKRVKDIREGKFKICVPAVTLMFKYLVEMFHVIKNTMEDAVKNKQKSAYKSFMIYASKFSLLSEVLFSSFYADENDLLYKDLAHEDWQKFFEVFDFYEADDLQKFSKQYKTLCEFLGKLSTFS